MSWRGALTLEEGAMIVLSFFRCYIQSIVTLHQSVGLIQKRSCHDPTLPH